MLCWGILQLDANLLETEELNMPENLDDKNFVVLNLYDVVKLHTNVAYLLELNTSEFKESYLIVEELKLSILSRVSFDLSYRFYFEI